jgi:hypothetical protein
MTILTGILKFISPVVAIIFLIPVGMIHNQAHAEEAERSAYSNQR